MDDFTGFQRDLLYVIEGISDPHGLGIKDEIKKYYATEVHHGRLYPNLDALVHKGFVSKEVLDRRKNTYVLTDRGERELEARCDWENQYVRSMLAEA
ncbi:PadR family transcriptional regulator [Natronorarus salvus]|uniref:PadR family transcriptional regulator n=1 Tax=Natronorarus salvus TaxID=3117733 RepID=UPI002F25F3F8